MRKEKFLFKSHSICYYCENFIYYNASVGRQYCSDSMEIPCIALIIILLPQKIFFMWQHGYKSTKEKLS